MEKEMSSMCNLSEGIWQDGVEQGLEQGRQQGLEQGRETEKLANIRSLMKTVKWTAKQAMDALDIPESDQSKYLAMLNA